MNKHSPSADLNVVKENRLDAGVNKDFIDHLKKVNDVFYDQVRIADQKAAYLFSFMLAFLVTSAEGRGAFSFQRYAGGDVIQAIISAILALSVATCVVSAILVVLPRTRGAGTSLYWGAWEANRPLLMEAGRAGDCDYLSQEYLGNIDNLAWIAARKYRFVGVAFRALLTAILAYVLLLTFR